MKIQETLFEKMDINEASGAMNMRFRFLYGNGLPTGNNRVYKAGVVKAAVEDLAKRIAKAGPAYGTAEHKPSPELDQVAHLITGASVDEKGDAWATVKILGTRAGKNLQAILRGGGRLGVSPRGHGSTTKNEKGQEVVGGDYRLDSVDFVLNPSIDKNWVGQEHIFEGMAIDEEHEDLARVRWQAAVRAGYRGELPDYLRDVYRPLLERQKTEAQKLDENAVTDEEAEAFEDRLTEALRRGFPDLALREFDEDYAYLFSLNESAWYRVRHEIDKVYGLKFGKPELMEM